MLILVVDDDPIAGEMTAAILEEAGHQILLADNGVAAMEQLSGHPGVNLVISDQNMPMISGVDLFNELRSQGAKVPFVLLTGDDAAALVRQAPGLDACLLKDDQLEENLARVVGEVTARS